MARRDVAGKATRLVASALPSAPTTSAEHQHQRSADPWELPRFRASFAFEDPNIVTIQADNIDYPAESDLVDREFYDVDFYPYSPASDDPIFAAGLKKSVIICRILRNSKSHVPCEVIHVVRDEDDVNYSLTWSKDVGTGKPLLCIAGKEAKIKVYDVVGRKLRTTLVGHGGLINDLTTSPGDYRLIASASEDTTVRIWSLDPKHEKQPCLIILGGEGHQWNLLSVSWHITGRYVLTAGHDQIVNLWTVPELPETSDMSTLPIVVHYPHFSSSSVHSSLIDCVAFFGDLVLSRACHEEVIVLWRIEGFSSDDPPPPMSRAPTNHDQSKATRSAFTTLSPASPSYYTELAHFHTPYCGAQFYMRFKILNRPGLNPVLAFCDTNSTVSFWDLARFKEYHRFVAANRPAAAAPPNDRASVLASPNGAAPPAAAGQSVSERRSAYPDASAPKPASLEVPSWLRASHPRGPRGGRGGGGVWRGSSSRGQPLQQQQAVVATTPANLAGAAAAGGDHEMPDAPPPQEDADEATGRQAAAASAPPGRKGPRGGRGGRGGSVNSAASGYASAAAAAAGSGLLQPQQQQQQQYSSKTWEAWDSRYSIGTDGGTVGGEALKPHARERVARYAAIGRQVAWSPEGDWCVAVGSYSLVALLHRWEGTGPPGAEA